MNKVVFLGLILMGMLSCTPAEQEAVIPKTIERHPLDRLPDNKGGEVVRKAIDYAGGWDAWEAKENFSFYKIITQLDSVGDVRKKIKQLHQYDMKPHFKANMTWNVAEDDYLIVNTGSSAKKYENGKWLEDDKSKREAWNSSFGSNYVVQMPFKLTDPGTVITYDNIDSMTYGKPVHAVKVEYEEGAGSSGGMHVWWYYFDAETYDLVANYLDYGNGHSITTYETFEDVDGIRIHNRRLSYSSNEKKEIGLLKTIYENEQMKFDQNFDEALFTLK